MGSFLGPFLGDDPQRVLDGHGILSLREEFCQQWGVRGTRGIMVDELRL